MAEDRRIIVEISGSVTVQNTDDKKNEDNMQGSQKNVSQKYYNSDNTARTLAALAYNKAKSNVTSSANITINRYFSLSENYMAETDYNNVMAVINKGMNLGATVATGAAVGGVPGAIIAAAAWGVQEFTNYQSRMSNYYQSLNATNYQTSFDRSRLGLTNEGKGTEN